MIIAIDFDGTLVEHAYPKIGAEVRDAFKWLRQFQARGAKLILWTIRSGQELADAINFCRLRGIEFWGINENPDQSSWSNSRKAYAHLYIDDAAFGCPTNPDTGRSNRPSADWEVIGPRVDRILEAENA